MPTCTPWLEFANMPPSDHGTPGDTDGVDSVAAPFLSNGFQLGIGRRICALALTTEQASRRRA